MNLSCLFGHSYSEEKEKIFLTLSDKTSTQFLYLITRVKAKRCKVCKEIKMKAISRTEKSDYRLLGVNNTKDTLVHLNTKNEKTINDFINDFNNVNYCRVKKEDFEYV